MGMRNSTVIETGNMKVDLDVDSPFKETSFTHDVLNGGYAPKLCLSSSL